MRRGRLGSRGVSSGANANSFKVLKMSFLSILLLLCITGKSFAFIDMQDLSISCIGSRQMNSPCLSMQN